MLEILKFLPVLVLGGVAGAVLGLWIRRPSQSKPIPQTWDLKPRLIFSAQERHIYRQLQTLFPRHIVLAKLPLTRFTQSANNEKLKYWFDLISNLHVSFAICTPIGRIVSVIDIETSHDPGKRSFIIKHAVMQTCDMQYLTFTNDDMPTLE